MRTDSIRRVAQRWLTGAFEPEKFVQMMGDTAVKFLRGRIEATQGKYLAKGTAFLVKEKTRTGWSVTVTMTGGANNLRGTSDLWLSMQVFANETDEVGLVVKSNGVHHLHGETFPQAKAKAGVLKQVKRLGEDWDDFAKRSGEAGSEQGPDPLSTVVGVLKRMKLGPAGRAHTVERDGRAGWDVDPVDRQRNDDSDWDWETGYAEPVQRAIEKGLASSFGPGLFGVDVGDKGHVYVVLTHAGKAHFKV